MSERSDVIDLVLGRVNKIEAHPPEAIRALRGDATNELFTAFPALGDRLPWRALGRFPTPIEEMSVPSGAARLFVKRDDLTCPAYGGNKVRKLEFLLADAQLAGADTLITLGGTGSNHALATAAFGRELGFEVDLILYRQPASPFVRRNLGGYLASGARLHFAGATSRAFLAARRLHSRRRREGARPRFIMVGGTSRLGCMGYVNAAFELSRQVREGLIPAPDTIFVALGTTGTAAGLLAGLKLAGLPARVVAVRVADPIASNARVLAYFANDALGWLRSADASIPAATVNRSDFHLLTGYFGKGYGRSTDEAEAAIRAAGGHVALEPTYTGKAFAACLDYCRRVDGPTNVLFWNTFNSVPVAEPDSWADLPSSLQSYIDFSDASP